VAQTAPHIRHAYNAKTYQQYNIRVRKNSNLNRRISEYKKNGASLNHLVTTLLCNHFEEPFPHPEKDNTPAVIKGVEDGGANP